MKQTRMPQARVPHSSTPPTPRSAAKRGRGMPRSTSGLADTGATLPVGGEGGGGKAARSKSL